MASDHKTTYAAGEFELVLCQDRITDPFVCSIYKDGGQIPLRRKSFKTELGALKWFDAFLGELEAKPR